jgi:hypothetical protein
MFGTTPVTWFSPYAPMQHIWSSQTREAEPPVYFISPTVSEQPAILLNPNKTAPFMFYAKRSEPLPLQQLKPKPAHSFSTHKRESQCAQHSRKWGTPSPALHSKPTMPPLTESPIPKCACENPKPLICAIIGSSTESDRNNSTFTGSQGTQTMPITFQSIIRRHITEECAPDISFLFYLHAHQSRPPCEGVFLPPGLSLRVLIHGPRDTKLL